MKLIPHRALLIASLSLLGLGASLTACDGECDTATETDCE